MIEILKVKKQISNKYPTLNSKMPNGITRLLFILLFLFINLFNQLYAQETFKLFGKVTDFNSKPIDSVEIILKDKNFNDLYKTISDKNGNFSLQVAKGLYYCLYAIKSEDYGKTKLEYWAWNVPVFNNIEINPQYDRMEIYELNAFEPQVSPQNTYIIYFRPMSLTKSLRLTNEKNKKEFEERAIKHHDTIDIAPSHITKDELTIRINGTDAKILSVQKILEYARGTYLYSYLVQVLKPKDEKDNKDIYDRITVILHSTKTNEYGKGELFVKKNKYQ